MPVQSSPRLYVSNLPVHLGSLVGYGSGTLVFQTNGPLHFGGSSLVATSGSTRGALFPAGKYRFDLTGDDDLYAIAPSGLVIVESLSVLDQDIATEITLTVGSPDPNPVAVPSAVGESLWLVDAWGNVTDFTTVLDEQYKQGLDGRFGPTWTNQIDTSPGRDGGFYRGTTAVPGTEVVNLEIVGDNPDELRAKSRDIARAINPKRGPQTMHIVTADAVHVTMSVIFESGFSADPATDGNTLDFDLALTFRQVDTYWSETRETSAVKTKQIDSDLFFPVGFPVAVGASVIFAEWFEDYDGDVPTSPLWIVRGSGSQLALINNTTGETFSMAGAIAPGQSVVINGNDQTVTDAYGNDLFGQTTGDIWDIPINGADITVQLLEPSDDASVTLSYFARYSGI